MINSETKFYLKIILIFSLIALISAYFIEYVLGHQPCNLCLIERIPYALSIVLITSIFLSKKNSKFFVLLLILTFIFALSISFYHLGIEQGFFKESTVCTVKNYSENISKEDLIKQLIYILVGKEQLALKVRDKTQS